MPTDTTHADAEPRSRSDRIMDALDLSLLLVPAAALVAGGGYMIFLAISSFFG